MSVSFVHLRIHSEYSLEDSVIRLNELVAVAKQKGFPALALTDQMNLFSAIKFYKACVAAGIKPIIGVDACLENTQTPALPFQITLLCQDWQGYQNLMQLMTRAYLEKQNVPKQSYRPVLKKEWLTSVSTKGLISLSGGMKGDIGQALLQDKMSLASQCLEFWQALFPSRFYLELQCIDHPQEVAYLKKILHLAHSQQVPVVATNDVRFLSEEDFEAHEARVCIQQGLTLQDPKRPRIYRKTQYLRSMEEMKRLFSEIPSALVNTVEIAKRCNLELGFGEIHLPRFPVPSGMTAEDYLVQQATQGLYERRKQSSTPQAMPEHYQKRLNSELETINAMGFAGYFLIVADFIRWAKAQHIPVGPGRGSGAGSLVAYALQITDLDPLHYDLLFERFLNAERVSLPDFDIDFCMEGRDRVIAYVTERYGAEAVSQIITFGTMAAKAVVRDVGRVLAYPYGMVDAVAKLIPFEVGITLDKAMEQDAQSSTGLKARYEQEEEIRTLIDLAKKLEGLVRNVGTHAGGIVIAPERLTRFTALYCEPNGSVITQLDKDDIESVGLVKFDFLGLRTLTIIDGAMKTINRALVQQGLEPIDMTQVALDDPKTFDLLRSGRVMAVFQLESRGIRALLRRLNPNQFDDITALLALFRPGPLQSGMVDDFIARKREHTQIQTTHPWLEPILRPTYGIILYQEQVMQIAQVLAGYTLGAADLLRRAMGKKKPEEMAKQRTIFMLGAQKKGVDPAIATPIFDLMEKFAGYGFNKSHSAAYALISYQTAWLKAHYPAEFMAAVLSSEMEKTEKLAPLLYECRAFKIKLYPPNVNYSEYAFTVPKSNAIRYGLGAIKGVGFFAVEHLIDVRQKGGAFQSLVDLCVRVDLKKINRRALEALIESGSLDELSGDRTALMAQLDQAIQMAVQMATSKQMGQAYLFEPLLSTSSLSLSNSENSKVLPWTFFQRLRREKATLGVYLSSHPIDYYQKELTYLTQVHLSQLESIVVGTRTWVAAWWISVRLLTTARGDRFAILLLEDVNCRLDLRLSDTLYQHIQSILKQETLLLLEVERSIDRVTEETRFTVHQVLDITQARCKWAKRLVIRLEEKALPLKKASSPLDLQCLEELSAALRGMPGPCPVFIEYHRLDVQLRLQLGADWNIMPKEDLLENLVQHFGEACVWIEYENTAQNSVGF